MYNGEVINPTSFCSLCMSLPVTPLNVHDGDNGGRPSNPNTRYLSVYIIYHARG